MVIKTEKNPLIWASIYEAYKEATEGKPESAAINPVGAIAGYTQMKSPSEFPTIPIGEITPQMATLEQNVLRTITDLSEGRLGLGSEARQRVMERVQEFTSGLGAIKRGMEERMRIAGREVTPGMEARFGKQAQLGISAVKGEQEATEYSRLLQGLNIARQHLANEQQLRLQRAQLEAQLQYMKRAEEERKKWQNINLALSVLGLGTSVVSGALAGGMFSTSPKAAVATSTLPFTTTTTTPPLEI